VRTRALRQANLISEAGIGRVLATNGYVDPLMAWLALVVGCSQTLVLEMHLEESTVSEE